MPGVWFAVQKWRGWDLNLTLKVESVRLQSLCSLCFGIWKPEKLSPRVSSVVEVASEMSLGGLAMWGGEGVFLSIFLAQIGWEYPLGVEVECESSGLGPEEVDPWMLGHSSSACF